MKQKKNHDDNFVVKAFLSFFFFLFFMIPDFAFLLVARSFGRIHQVFGLNHSCSNLARIREFQCYSARSAFVYQMTVSDRKSVV